MEWRRGSLFPSLSHAMREAGEGSMVYAYPVQMAMEKSTQAPILLTIFIDRKQIWAGGYMGTIPFVGSYIDGPES